MTSTNNTNSKTNLNKPQHPGEASTTPTPTASDRKALATSTAAAHGMRSALNSQVDHIAGLQSAFIEAASPVADQASDFLAAAISGELLWGEVSRRTQEKLNSLPKPDRVDLGLGLERLQLPAWQPSGATTNRFLPSSGGAAFEAKAD